MFGKTTGNFLQKKDVYNTITIYQSNMIKKVLFLFACSISLFSFSQITGNVTGSSNETLAFVNIYIENTYKGTTSNEDGNYELMLLKPEIIP